MQYFKKRFGIFIDEERKGRKISKEIFIEGICSFRQYKRYLSGEYYIPNDKLIMFAERLKIDVVDLFQKYDILHNHERSNLMNCFRLLSQYRYSDVYKIINDINPNALLSDLNVELITYLRIVSKYRLNIITRSSAKAELMKLIDYKNCIKKQSLNLVELNVMMHVAMIDSEEGIRASTIKMYNKLIDINKDIHNEASIVASLYANTSHLLGYSGEYSKSLEISLLGIDYCLEHKTLKSLSNLYYYAALAELLSGKKSEAISLAKKSFYALFLENNDNKFNHFKDDFEKEFKMKISEILV
ncbi:hypothetical protein KHQ82_04545 [Mycoplasmatota bacterium]|nr:hypothetical protein KHQ82_04545 [Mycoplasmatota bacterium]